MCDIQNLAINTTVTLSWETTDEDSQTCKTHRWPIKVEQINGEDYFELDKKDSGFARFISEDGSLKGKDLLQKSTWLDTIRTMRASASIGQHGETDDLFTDIPKPSRWFKKQIKDTDPDSEVVELKLHEFEFNNKMIHGITMKVKKSNREQAKPIVQLSLSNLAYIRNAILASTKDGNNRRERCPVKLPPQCFWVKRKYKEGNVVRGFLVKKSAKKQQKRQRCRFFPATTDDYDSILDEATRWRDNDDESDHSTGQDDENDGDADEMH
jgi:hypothetical protein